jgi:dolichol-phosphate mannosyltransferase
LPLRLGVIFGIFMGALSIVVGIYSLVMKLLGYVIPGYTTVVVLISFLFAVQLFVTGLIGEYLGFLFEENKKRPIYIVDKVISHEQHNGEVE